jgi:two-component system, NtrC family, response regulator PilR
MALMRQQVAKLAAANLPVLLTGESGTGKGVMAAMIHASSPAANRPFIPVNCAFRT